MGVIRIVQGWPGLAGPFRPRARERCSENKGQRIRVLTSFVQKRFNFPENSVELFAGRVENRAACAMAQCELVRLGHAHARGARKSRASASAC